MKITILTDDSLLASALAEAEESALRNHAQVTGRAIRNEDGGRDAIRVIESRLGKSNASAKF
jgi:hypothetical protein